MSKKRDSAAQRLNGIIEVEKQRRLFLGLLGDPRVRSAGMLNDPSDPLNRARQLTSAFRIAKSETALKKAFEAFELDPAVPENWHRLICYLADCHFGSKRAGAPVEWTSERRVRLLQDFRETLKKYPEAKRPEIRDRMINDRQFRGRYNMSNDALKRQITKTLKWASPWFS